MLALIVVSAQSVTVKLEGEQLHVAAPQLHFLAGNALGRLQSGIALTYVLKAGIAVERAGKPLNEIRYRFVISYDIFEEKFAVNRLEPNPHSITHLSQAAAELWCLDSIALPAAKLSPDQLYWIAVEYSEEQPKVVDSSESLIDQLIYVFSRKAQ